MTVLLAGPSSLTMLIVIVAFGFVINPSTRKTALGALSCVLLLILVGLPFVYLLRTGSFDAEKTATLVDYSSQVPSPAAAALPEWANKPRHWEGDTYVVPLATAFSTNPTGSNGNWGYEMDQAAALELEQTVRAAAPPDARFVINHTSISSSDWQGVFGELKHRISSEKWHLEVAETSTNQRNGLRVDAPTRYRMHGVLRFDPASRQQLQDEFKRRYEVKLVWQTPPELTAEKSSEIATADSELKQADATTTATDSVETTTAATEVAGPAEPATDSASASPRKPDWVGQPPHREGDVYVVPVASGFGNTKPFDPANGPNEGPEWEKRMDKAAAESLEQAVRAIVPLQPNAYLDGDYWPAVYQLVKYKLWSSERYVETASIAISEHPAYQLHGVMRITPEVLQILEPKLPLTHVTIKDSVRASERDVKLSARPQESPARTEINLDFSPNTFSIDYGFVFFVGLLLILLLAAVVALLAHPRTRRGTLISAVGLVLIAPLLAWPYLQKVKRDFAGRPEIERLHAVTQVAEQAPTHGAVNTTTTDSVATKSKDSTADKPAWVDQPKGLQGSIYRVAVKSDLFVTDQECDNALRAKAAAAVDRYVDDLFGELTSQKLRRELNPRRYIKETYRETVTSPSVGPMRQAHALVQFDDQARSLLLQRWQELLASERLSRVALITASVIGLLAIAFAYLKFDLRTGGQIRGRLRFAAVGAIIVLATSVAAVCHAFEL